MARRGVLTYHSPEEMQEAIDRYFESCKGEPLTNSSGDPVYDKYGFPIIINSHPPTITGLALALGFTTRLSLLNYQAKREFKPIVEKAKARVEAYTEERLFDKDGAAGARFSLQYNFRGWKEEKSDENNGPVINIINDIPRNPAPQQNPEISGGADEATPTDSGEVSADAD